MAGWEERGYVADSEEEEDGLSDKSESQKHDIIPTEDLDHLHDVPAYGPVGSVWDLPSSSRETDELQNDGYQIQSRPQPRSGNVEPTVAQGFQPHDDSPRRLLSPSPLLLPPLSPTSHSSPKSQLRDGDLDGSPMRSTARPQNVDEPVVLQQQNASEFPDQRSNQPARSLRQRNPIQLHPYVIESEKYRQTLKASGYKPLRIAQIESQAASALQDDSQGGDFLAGVDSQDESGQANLPPSSSSIMDSHDSLTPPIQPAIGNFDLDRGELPDVEAILQRMSSTVEVRGHKRRKVMPFPAEKSRQQTGSGNLSGRFELQGSATAGNDEGFNIPLSPPLPQTPKSSSAGRPHSRGFRFPRGIPPVPLPTPVASSEPRRQARLVPQSSQTDSHVSADQILESGTEASASEPEGVSHPRLEGMQRKIRGVLPASWLKLDLKTQARKPNGKVQRHETSSPERDITHQRGVARPVIARRIDDKASDSVVQIVDSSSDSGSDNERSGELRSPTCTTPVSSAMTIPSNDEDLPLLSDFWGEVAEDNRIDAMLPLTARRKAHQRLQRAPNSKKRQLRLTDLHATRGQPSVHSLPKEPRSRNNDQPRTTQSSAKPRKPKFRPPDLSLLDVPSIGMSSDGHAPSFIRVAQRACRSRKDRGKSKPNGKYLRMTTELETDDVNECLRSWREGTLKPRVGPRDLDSGSSVGIRSPLQPCSGNERIMPERSPSPSPSPRQGSVGKAQHTVQPQPKSRLTEWPKARSIQITLNNIVRLATNRNQANYMKSKPGRRSAARNQPRERRFRAGHVLSSVEESGQSRPATLEALQAKNDDGHGRSTFHRRLHSDTYESVHRASPNPLLAKFLHDTSPTGNITHDPDETHADDFPLRHVHVNLRTRGRRKRTPRRAPEQTLPIQDADQALENFQCHSPKAGQLEKSGGRSVSLIGLGSAGTTYSTSFNIAPLPTGTCFGERTFIGSGNFEKSFIASDLDQNRGFSVFEHSAQTFRWGPWNDSVSTELGALIDDICGNSEQSPHRSQEKSNPPLEITIDLLKQILHYLSINLSFYDAIDRIAFLQRCKKLLSRLLSAVAVGCSEETDINMHVFKQLRDRAMSLCTVFMSQLSQISKHNAVPYALQADIRASLQEITSRVLGIVLSDDSAGIAACLNHLKQSGNSPTNLDERYASVELLVIAYYVLEQADSLSSFWQAARSTISPRTNNVRVLEACWKRLFSVLPFLKLDRQGVLDGDRRQRNSIEDWATVKSLLEPVFNAYELNTYSDLPNVNRYCRALFGRCLHLINDWGWRRCESIIGALFDFFARRNLFHLPNEECRGSPAFLAHLDVVPDLQFAPEDRCFHIFLKIIGSGLHQMQKVYPGKKIRDVIWRLMPNHGRFLPKDQAVQQRELDALRNHHDLLCTLYWASPSGFRPKPTVIQNLVDVENSHKEASRINIRAWSNLVAFQLTTGAPLANLTPFILWWNDLLRQLLQQHQNARIEAEEQANLAESTESVVINRSLLESTVAQNQRQVEGMLKDVLLSLKNAISSAPDLAAATMLLSPDLASVFSLFSAQSSNGSKVIVHSLEVVLMFASKAMPTVQTEISAANDDSQDYGDWSAFETDVLPNPSVKKAACHLENYFQAPLRQLLSNCFGADIPPDDALLMTVIDTWVAISHVWVHEGRRAWTDYIGKYGQDSWESLRDTEQTRKFSTYYLAAMVETDRKVFDEYRQAVLKGWTASLVERELLLKHQHRLTSSLLNANVEDPVLVNPPFWTVDGRFEITPSEFSQRRLSLISNILSNMRKAVDLRRGRKASETATIVADFKEILKVMMNAMKSNYQQLGQGTEVRGAYVDFVHRVVDLLQQHTSSICPIDRFFTDSSSFPLPATDPTYVVGQLKNYGMRLHNHRTSKQLAVFIQSVSERAAVDGQQPYLVDQLHSAMATSTQSKCQGSSDLRYILCTTIFPAYIGLALSTACGWILAVPVLQALTMIFSSMVTEVNGFDKLNVDSVSTMIMTVLKSLRDLLALLADQPGLIEQPKVLRILAACFAAITAAVPVMDYLCRVSKKHQTAKALMASFQSYGLYAAQSLLGHTDTEEPDIVTLTEITIPTQHADVHSFTLQELRETLTKTWICHDEHYYVNRGFTRREVVVDLGLFEEEKADFICQIEMLFNALDRVMVLGSRS
ncbi:MAG: hypothetical protein LQ338_005381 [Usnochroma carphineum]|nr:MAG: hypothetical protein LQ338_005381 [Usnochroma carphineum]